jgi:hypothetical protein
MTVRIALAGDTMLGRGVGALLGEHPSRPLCAPEVAEVARSADLFVLNLECCISARGRRWPDPTKPFFFRAPPAAADSLAALGVDAVTLANNHALDYGPEALLDTLGHLDAVGIAHAGAGADAQAARRPAMITGGGTRVGIVSLSDHPRSFAAAPDRPGIAFADLRSGMPAWVLDAIATSQADVVVVSPHWGPNMAPAPVPHVRTSAQVLARAGARVVAGHSAHVFQGVKVLSGPSVVLYDLGDFVDDYAVDDVLRNDLGLLWLLTLDRDTAVRLELLPLQLEYAFTRAAVGADRAWIVQRLRSAVAPLDVTDSEGLLRIDLVGQA